MATKKIAHVLSDEEQIAAIAKRIKRAQGQLGAVARMLEEGRNCEEIVTQMSAVSKAVNTAAFTLISASLKECIVEGKNTQKIFENLDNIGIFSTQQEFLNTLIHTADISNPTKSLHIYDKWVNLVMDEFWQQGDREKEMSLPISFLCDRVTTKVPASQLGFMDGIVYPLVQIVVGFLPGMNFMIENINKNKAHFKRLKEEEDKNKK